MKKTAILSLILMFSFPIAQEIEYENLMNTKWNLKNYIIDGQSFPIEKKRKKDYYILKKNNQKEELLYGKKVKGSWEFLPHGKFIMFYSEKMDVYVPMRITELTNDNLKMTVFDINTMKMITVSYTSN
jgi:hypothetical protein|tara:strand:+ start:222 stop:605 length:384 start_codon:yes stop_codon:yes gene_type:complete